MPAAELIDPLKQYYPYVLLVIFAAFASWLLKDPTMDFLAFFFREAREFFTLRPTLKALNFLGLVLGVAVLMMFLLPTPLHEFYDLVHGERHSDVAAMISAATGCFAAFLFFTSLLICLRTCRGEP